MKKLLVAVMPVKTFASYILAGLMCLYMVTGSLYAAVMDEPFDYSIPFIFVLEGIGLSLLIATLWTLIFNERANRKRRWFPRLIIFAVSLMALLAICLLVFVAIPTEWAKLWLIVAGCVAFGVVVLSVIAELFFRATGKKYTEILKEYQANV